MKRTNWLCAVLLLAACGMAGTADTLVRGVAQIAVQPKAPMKAWAFDLTRVRVLDPRFLRAQEADAKYLLSIDVDRLLSRFRQYSGLPPKGPEYKGWESATISGHTLGHYLSAVAMMYASTGDQRFLERANYIIDDVALAPR